MSCLYCTRSVVVCQALAGPFCVLVEVESTRAIALMVLETFGFGFAGASLTLAFAPSGVVGVFRVHVFGQAVFKVDNHCVALFVLVVSVSHASIVPQRGLFVNPSLRNSCSRSGGCTFLGQCGRPRFGLDDLRECRGYGGGNCWGG